MATFTFAFDEAPVIVGGIEWFLTGEAEVHYGVQPAEPDVGVMSGYAEDLCFDDDAITLKGFFKLADGSYSDDYAMTLQRGQFAFDAIEMALQDAMAESAIEDAYDRMDDCY